MSLNVDSTFCVSLLVSLYKKTDNRAIKAVLPAQFNKTSKAMHKCMSLFELFQSFVLSPVVCAEFAETSMTKRKLFHCLFFDQKGISIQCFLGF